MNRLKISIVTPTFNQAAYLEKTINSVLNQDYPNLEYIIIDGGSTDGSVEIIKKFANRITYWISEPDFGQSDALNKGFSKSTGDILGYINSDDLYSLTTFNKISTYFTLNPDIDLIYGNSVIIDDKDKVIGMIPALPFNLKEHLNGVFSIPQPSSFWRREVLENVKGFNINNHSCMDGEFFAYAAARNFRFKKVDVILSQFRIHSHSKTGALNSEIKKRYRLDESNYIQNISHKNNIPVSKYLAYFYYLKYLPIRLITKLIFKVRRTNSSV